MSEPSRDRLRYRRPRCGTAGDAPGRQNAGGWHWAVRTADGPAVAEPVEMFDHPAAYGYARHDLRLALARSGLETDGTAARAS